ncbi:MAG: helix-turn-helix transcriptional regulator [Clostridia bacterium]|jgi:transcriptional regulator with XRE-family HTH domain|nr:helix-turn-helix transcriptional regulator [Clostridia bacterium]
MDAIEQLGKVIKNARVKNNLSQEQLAELLGVSPSHIKHMESGLRKPSVENLFQLVQILHFSLDALIQPELLGMDERAQDIRTLLADCSPQQLELISDLIRAVRKKNIN